MKKLLFISLFIFVIFILVGCSKNEDNKPNDNEPKESDPVVDPEPEPDPNVEPPVPKETIDGKKLVVFGDSITALGTWGKGTAEEAFI